MALRASQYRRFNPQSRDTARYIVRAWGSHYHPDLNEEWDEIPTSLTRLYPFVDIQRLDALPTKEPAPSGTGQTRQ